MRAEGSIPFQSTTDACKESLEESLQLGDERDLSRVTKTLRLLYLWRLLGGVTMDKIFECNECKARTMSPRVRFLGMHHRLDCKTGNIETGKVCRHEYHEGPHDWNGDRLDPQYLCLSCDFEGHKGVEFMSIRHEDYTEIDVEREEYIRVHEVRRG